MLAWLRLPGCPPADRFVAPTVELYTSATPRTSSSISITSARVLSGGVPGGIPTSICR